MQHYNVAFLLRYPHVRNINISSAELCGSISVAQSAHLVYDNEHPCVDGIWYYHLRNSFILVNFIATDVRTLYAVLMLT